MEGLAQLNYSETDVIFQTLIQSDITSDPYQKSYIVVILCLIVALLIISTNLRVIYIIVDATGRTLRFSCSVLVAHLSCISIGFTFVLCVEVLNLLHIIPIHGNYLCGALSLWKNILYGAYPLNVAGIVYERTIEFCDTDETLLVERTILFIWMVSAILNFPTLFWQKHDITGNEGVGACKQTMLFGSFQATLVFGLCQFILFHFLITCGIGQSLFRIRSKIRFLYICQQIPKNQNHSVVRRLRFIFLYSTLFILLWIPVGVMTFLQSTRQQFQIDYSTFQPFVTAVLILNYLYMCFTPFFFLFLYHGVSTKYWIRVTCNRQTPISNKSETHTNGVDHEGKENHTGIQKGTPV